MATAIITVGNIGGGKSTQGKLLQSRLGLEHISTGAICRARQANPVSAVDQIIKDYMDQNQLVEDDVINDMMAEELKLEKYQAGIILDGYPRTKDQIAFCEHLLVENGFTLEKVIFFELPEKVSEQRLEERFKIEGRMDDATPEARKQRREDYDLLTRPVVEYYQNTPMFAIIDANQPQEKVYQDLVAILDPANERLQNQA